MNKTKVTIELDECDLLEIIQAITPRLNDLKERKKDRIQKELATNQYKYVLNLTKRLEKSFIQTGLGQSMKRTFKGLGED